ncbi:MAG TPA: SGNH/GDSL hydrolase family protein [Xanthobacteraceae bacterium]|nr:SGNH/GDSL hydrolase family protein [Xanthobacteraceae bacterium]
MLRRFFFATFLAAAAAGGACAEDSSPFAGDCKGNTGVAHFESGGLVHVAARVAQKEAITVVAFGSSSTEGVGASSVLATYPARLEAELKRHFPGIPVRVVNRGVSGEDVAEMLKRFDRDIMKVKPDLVIWQLGTNAILRDDGITPEQPLIMEGLRRFKKANADLVMMEPQYAPKVLRDPDAVPMVEMLRKIAKRANIPLFHRFDLMRHWRDDLEMPYETFLSPDLLHMNDFSYGCTARYLAEAIAEDVNATRKTIDAVHASVPRTSPVANSR